MCNATTFYIWLFGNLDICGRSLERAGRLDERVQVGSVLGNDTFQLGTDLVVVNDVEVELVQPSELFVQRSGDLGGGFEVGGGSDVFGDGESASD